MADVLPPLPRIVGGKCENQERPCLHVRCPRHLYLDVRPSGTLKINWPGLDPDEIPETCAVDVAARGEQTLEQVAKLLNVTRERVRQIERRALARLLVSRAGRALLAGLRESD